MGGWRARPLQEARVKRDGLFKTEIAGQLRGWIGSCVWEGRMGERKTTKREVCVGESVRLLIFVCVCVCVTVCRTGASQRERST